MRKITFKIFLLLFTFGILSTAYSQKSYDFDSGLKAAKSQNKKVLVNIYSDSDKWCSKMDSEVYSNSEIQDIINSNFIYVKLNGLGDTEYTYNGKKYKASDLAKLLGLTSYPTHAFLNPDGSVIKFKYNGVESSSFPGYADLNDFKNILIYFKDGKYKDTDLSTVL